MPNGASIRLHLNQQTFHLQSNTLDTAPIGIPDNEIPMQVKALYNSGEYEGFNTGTDFEFVPVPRPYRHCYSCEAIAKPVGLIEKTYDYSIYFRKPKCHARSKVIHHVRRACDSN